MSSPAAVLPMPSSLIAAAESERLSVAFMANSVEASQLTLSVKVVGVSWVRVSWLRSLTEIRPTSTVLADRLGVHADGTIRPVTARSTVEAANAGKAQPISTPAMLVCSSFFMTGEAPGMDRNTGCPGRDRVLRVLQVLHLKGRVPVDVDFVGEGQAIRAGNSGVEHDVRVEDRHRHWLSGVVHCGHREQVEVAQLRTGGPGGAAIQGHDGAHGLGVCHGVVQRQRNAAQVLVVGGRAQAVVVGNHRCAVAVVDGGQGKERRAFALHVQAQGVAGQQRVSVLVEVARGQLAVVDGAAIRQARRAGFGGDDAGHAQVDLAGRQSGRRVRQQQARQQGGEIFMHGMNNLCGQCPAWMMSYRYLTSIVAEPSISTSLLRSRLLAAAIVVSINISVTTFLIGIGLRFWPTEPSPNAANFSLIQITSSMALQLTPSNDSIGSTATLSATGSLREIQKIPIFCRLLIRPKP